MKFYADLHIHSPFSRATSSQLTFEQLHAWGMLKGIGCIGTGDCLHPSWFSQCRTRLLDDGTGLFSLKEEHAAVTRHLVPAACSGTVRFMLTTEISNIYKKNGKVRKVHNVICLPSLAAAEKLITRLERIGNLKSDGRPILGLDSRDLFEIALESDPNALLIPAHIWTPWFSALGSKSGFDSIQECYGDLAPHVHAVETGLSSDPPMNWRLSSLDPFVLVSSSDAHSPSKLGRECTVFDTDLSYGGIFKALSDPHDTGLDGTIEFFPEEGKYHVDGHRKCGVRYSPQESAKSKGLCPRCGRPLTIGVMSRVEELADREPGIMAPRGRPYKSLIPLAEIIAEALDCGPETKSVQQVYRTLLHTIGSEFSVLLDADTAAIASTAGDLIAEGIRRMRSGEVMIEPGYDGEYGTVHLFTQEERHTLGGQESLFKPSTAIKRRAAPGMAARTGGKKKAGPRADAKALPNDKGNAPHTAPPRLNDAQRIAVEHENPRLLIVAGPGTGKTHTLTQRIARCSGRLPDGQKSLALTFSNKAAEEMRERLTRSDPEIASRVFVGTIHAFCLALLRRFPSQAVLPTVFAIAEPHEIQYLAALAWPDERPAKRRTLLREMGRIKSTVVDGEYPAFVTLFDTLLLSNGLLDFDTILVKCFSLLRSHPDILNAVRNEYPSLFVDEYQDINEVQHAILLLLAGTSGAITAIGDPHQSIYGFRGAEVRFFKSFTEDFPGAVCLSLTENYRTAAGLLQALGQLILPAQDAAAPRLVPSLAIRGRLTVHEAHSDRAEAEYIVHTIEQLVGGTSMLSHDTGRISHGGYAERSFSDIAVLYRVNSLRRDLEEALRRSGIPFNVTGEQPLHSRPPVALLIGLLRLAMGEKIAIETLCGLLEQAVTAFTPAMGSALFHNLKSGFRFIDCGGLQSVLSSDGTVPGEMVRAFASFFNTVEAVGELLASNRIEQALAICATLQPVKTELEKNSVMQEIRERLDRIARISSSCRHFMDTVLLQREEDGTIGRSEQVSCMTLHASKGLEWPVVFIMGCEEGILPLSREERLTDMNEERRLLYVGMSRAKEFLYLTHARQRLLYGEKKSCSPSPFLADIEDSLKRRESDSLRKNRPKPAEAEQLTLF
ncbi:MAG: UvrD-helicase domain-containing protein [Chitinispirillaceae bacterium]|nr:UvrD-helicase domain-containing protein [Chitinispirillaceae bacterium]